MNFKLPFYRIGITRDADRTIKIAILQKSCKGWIVRHCQQILEGEKWSCPKKYFTAVATFSLSGSEVLVKGSFSSLKNKKNILQVALTNLEASLALPWESLIVRPQLNKATEKGDTPLTLWIAQKSTLNLELSFLSQTQIFPTTLSCRAADIFFLAEQSPLKALRAYFLIYAGPNEITTIFVKDRALLVARSFPNCTAKKSCEDLHATLQYIQEAFPNTVLPSIHIAQLSSALKKAVEQKLSLPLVVCQLMTFNVEEDDWAIYGDAITAAYQGASKNAFTFPYDTTSSSPTAQKHWLQRSAILIGQFALLVTLVLGIASTVKLKALSNTVANHFALVCPEEPNLPKSLKAAKQVIKKIDKHHSTTSYSYLPTIPTSEQTIRFLLALAKHSPSLTFSYFCYNLTSFPCQENPNLPYRATVEVQGQGKHEEVFQFLKKISDHPKLHHVSQTLGDEQSFQLQFTLTS
ncbi:hypothetical protein [Candidatus Chlamydia sanziniae]|uniref:Uncharacterized protein n=1 Tax=Candidatus Chlamydia sanziniae TaxID=1806891 RepID=A0A1A9HUA5_9CHLA|nr:hypothetical protein [Candidatus Chlamydia sanziniae]ANH78568.1 hypothetical protein Cs308_0397 [Candidatus Chlamydia sanziniae]